MGRYIKRSEEPIKFWIVWTLHVMSGYALATIGIVFVLALAFRAGVMIWN